MKAIIFLNCVISIVFTLCYAYQFFYIFVGLLKKPTEYTAAKQHRFAVVVSARNESSVIGNLIRSIREQRYPSELVDIFVIADNCTDNTAEIAREAGAIVYERFNKEQVGKGYALDWMFNIIRTDYAEKAYEAYIIFDADNILDPNYIAEMNKVFDNGYRIITSYRNSKNYDGNWITAGYSLWFLREAKYLNNARMQLGTSCAISGTGFLVSAEVIKDNNGWIHHLLTEDIEFTIDSVIKGEKIGYCANAVLYDEQPTQFRQSYTQRLRWAKGFYQVFANYGSKLFKGIFKGNFACFDMLMTIMPAMLLTLLSIAINIVAIPVGIITHSPELPVLIKTLLQTIGNFYCMFLLLGAITTITEWGQIHCSKVKRVLYLFTFPIFMLTYVPIAIVALFKKVEWKPITHTVSKSLSEICREEMSV
ncbi:MAG: glycosyltransferase family 2 protein [Clostridia bacterium]|nr:glycosyltransferase family 2 protein [Clostridia bacterium]MBQ4107364.1 glycosyltransferase family 2 protein [Lentisphaeria bacterium]